MTKKEIIYNDKVYYCYPDHDDKRKRYPRLSGWRVGSPLQAYLHRQVWVDVYGKIEKGHQIHHVNHDIYDNRIENLKSMTLMEHLAEHKEDRKIWANSQQNKDNLNIGRAHGIAWMKSPKGKEHASRLGIIQRDKSKVEKNCTICFKKFTAIDMLKPAIYCSKACKRTAVKRMKKLIVCEICKKEVLVSKYSESTCCFGKCTALKGHKTRELKRQASF